MKPSTAALGEPCPGETLPPPFPEGVPPPLEQPAVTAKIEITSTNPPLRTFPAPTRPSLQVMSDNTTLIRYEGADADRNHGVLYFNSSSPQGVIDKNDRGFADLPAEGDRSCISYPRTARDATAHPKHVESVCGNVGRRPRAHPASNTTSFIAPNRLEPFFLRV